MNNQMNEIEVVKAYFESLASGDLPRLGSLLADNIVWHQPGSGRLSKTYVGKSEVFNLFGEFMQTSQGTFKIESVSSIMANGNLVAATLRFAAKKPGVEIAMSGVDLMKVENGKIQEVHLFSENQATEDAFW